MLKKFVHSFLFSFAVVVPGVMINNTEADLTAVSTNNIAYDNIDAERLFHDEKTSSYWLPKDNDKQKRLIVVGST
jgi:hypothetical protein